LWLLPHWAPLFHSAALPAAPPLLVDSGEGGAGGGGGGGGSAAVHSRTFALEVELTAPAGEGCVPVVAVVTRGRGLLLYRALTGGGHGLRFARLPHSYVSAAAEAEAAEAGGGEAEGGAAPLLPGPNGAGGDSTGGESTKRFTLSPRTPALVRIPRLGATPPLLDSLLLLGAQPLLLCFLRGAVWTHALRVVGLPARHAFTGAAPFHSSACQHGLLLSDSAGLVRVCALEPHPRESRPTKYDSDWPLSKMLLRGTPHGVVVLPADKALAVAVSVREQRLDEAVPPEELTEAERAALDDEETRRAARPPPPRWREAYSVRLLDAESWATEASYALREDEWVMCMRLLPLRDAATRAVTHRLVVGTAIFSKG